MDPDRASRSETVAGEIVSGREAVVATASF
jgi:hypothetical protein